MTRTLAQAQRIVPGLLAGLAACAPAEGAGIRYEGIETRMLDDGLAEIRVALSGAAEGSAVAAYAGCAAARLALARGAAYARPIRMTTQKSFGAWRADAVYLISRERPVAGNPVPASATARACAVKGIPTV